MESTMRGVVGLGVTLLILGAGMATVNGLARGWAMMRLAKNPQSQAAQAVLMLF